MHITVNQINALMHSTVNQIDTIYLCATLLDSISYITIILESMHSLKPYVDSSLGDVGISKQICDDRASVLVC